MADSGSFDSGDVAALADLDALLALVDAKCAEAGVDGAYSLYPGWYAANRTVNSAAACRAIVRAYLRAWDASSNQPGTRQELPEVGDDFAGALFQNMWTQLNQMAFNPWIDWDESAQAGIAGDNVFCVMFDGAAGAADVGEGCGLSGADATFSLYGSPNAAGAYGRHNNGGGWYIPQAVADLLLNEEEYTVILKTYQLSACYTNTAMLWMYNTGTGAGNGYLRHVEGGGCNQHHQLNSVGAWAGTASQSSWAYHYWWRKNGYIGTGWDTVRRTSRSAIANTSGEVLTTSLFTNQATHTKSIGFWPGYGAWNNYYKYFIVSKMCLLD